jgi:phospholipid/cholesterol/gamma-HCH transport system substrate-binding protein
LNDLSQAIRSIENNPQQFIFGKKQEIPEYPAR